MKEWRTTIVSLTKSIFLATLLMALSLKEKLCLLSVSSFYNSKLSSSSGSGGLENIWIPAFSFCSQSVNVWSSLTSLWSSLWSSVCAFFHLFYLSKLLWGKDHLCGMYQNFNCIGHVIVELSYRVPLIQLLSNSISTICPRTHIWILSILRQFNRKIEETIARELVLLKRQISDKFDIIMRSHFSNKVEGGQAFISSTSGQQFLNAAYTLLNWESNLERGEIRERKWETTSKTSIIW